MVVEEDVVVGLREVSSMLVNRNALGFRKCTDGAVEDEAS